MTNRKRKGNPLAGRILSKLKRAGRTRYVRPWSVAEVQDGVTGKREDVQLALESLVAKGELRKSRGLPVVYYLEP